MGKKISGKDLVVNSSDKLGRHLDEVKSGCGIHKSGKDYCRKKKHKNKMEE